MPWTIPALLILIAGATHGTGGTLAEAKFYESLRRAFIPPAARSLTMEDLAKMPARGAVSGGDDVGVIADEARAVAAPTAKTGGASSGADDERAKAKEENQWRERMTRAREALERDQILAEAMQGRVAGLANEIGARDDPAQRTQLIKQRERALQELERMKQQVERGRLAVANIEDDARKKGVPPGWIR